jgi:hypothetical protein
MLIKVYVTYNTMLLYAKSLLHFFLIHQLSIILTSKNTVYDLWHAISNQPFIWYLLCIAVEIAPDMVMTEICYCGMPDPFSSIQFIRSLFLLGRVLHMTQLFESNNSYDIDFTLQFIICHVASRFCHTV